MIIFLANQSIVKAFDNIVEKDNRFMKLSLKKSPS